LADQQVTKRDTILGVNQAGQLFGEVGIALFFCGFIKMKIIGTLLYSLDLEMFIYRYSFKC
jgi:hypothetical protein